MIASSVLRRAALAAAVGMCLLALASAAGRPVYDASGTPTSSKGSDKPAGKNAPSSTPPPSAGSEGQSLKPGSNSGGSDDKPPAAAPSTAPAPTTGYSGFARGSDILKISLGQWNGDHTCDVSGSFFGSNSYMSQELKVYMENGKVRMHSIVKLLRPSFPCVFETVGSCTKGSDTQCDKSLAPIICKVDGYPRWDDSCSIVTVPRLETIRVCIDGAKREQYPVEISPTCSSIQGTYKKVE